jgi:glycosyltransferase involved in cell wall biosynthesis
MKKLIYFTASYPYGIAEQWKTNELNELIHHFDEITVIPYSYARNFDNPKKMPQKVGLRGPLFKKDEVEVRKVHLLQLIFHKKFFLFLKEFFAKKVYQDKSRFNNWLSTCINVLLLLRHPVIKEVIKKADKDTVMYFYWGRGSCEMLPFIDTSRFSKIFVRMHRYDLFEDEKNYIPFRRQLLNRISIAAPSSVRGELHLKQLYPQSTALIKCFRCGTLGNGKRSNASSDKVFRIVSCSLFNPVKRVHLMIECLQYLEFPVLWRHIGDGPLRKEMEALVERLGMQQKFIFEGLMDSTQIVDFYTNNEIDLFVNVSASEGVPFSIMEALSCGIPVLATNVGGTGEMVNEQVGKPVPEDISAKELAKAITELYERSPEEKEKLRKSAYESYLQNWDAKKLAKELSLVLKQ